MENLKGFQMKLMEHSFLLLLGQILFCQKISDEHLYEIVLGQSTRPAL